MIEKLHLKVKDLGKLDGLVIDMIIDFNEIDEVAVVVIWLRKLGLDDLDGSLFVFEIIFFVDDIIGVEVVKVFGASVLYDRLGL